VIELLMKRRSTYSDFFMRVGLVIMNVAI